MTRTPGSPAVTTHLEARFLAVVSHELRTPLTTIASFAESLDTDDLAPAERSQALQAVRRNTDRMLTLVEDLMVISRLQTGDFQLTVGTIDPAALVAETAELLAAREPDTAAVLELTDGPPLTGDRVLLLQLLYAVLGTVAGGAADRKATVGTVAGPDGWTITVAARQSEPLSDEHLMAGMLTEPGPPHRRRSTALWMLLADAVAIRHGGSVQLTYDQATGAGATVRLPLKPPAA